MGITESPSTENMSNIEECLKTRLLRVSDLVKSGSDLKCRTKVKESKQDSVLSPGRTCWLPAGAKLLVERD